MEFVYIVIALITAGVALITGLLNLFTGLHKDGEKLDVVFGAMCLCMFIFFLVPPIGFIVEDKAPYPLQIEIKRLFNFSFLALFPWFVLLYTGYSKKIMAYIIDALVILMYVMMVSTKTDSAKPFWVMIDLIVLGANLIFGCFAGFNQLKHGDRKNARWLIIAMSFYALFYILTFINQVGNNFFGAWLGAKLFFPINLFPLAFMLIMTLRLTANIFEKYRLEKILHLQDARWDDLIQNMSLLIVELDKAGTIKYLNPYAVKVLEYSSRNDLVGKNWFDIFIPDGEKEKRESFYRQIVEDKNHAPHIVNHVITKNRNKLIINWTAVLIYDNNFEINGTMNVGLNITAQEKAFEEIQFLKIQLEKESLSLQENQDYEEHESGIIGKSETILSAIQKARHVSITNAAVLLEGETGVGKELFANLIHKHSWRSNKPLIKTNCAALPPELIESELFGHEKGSFTGALQMRKGRFELANGGTIFLDEIGELPIALQPKLLRVLQNGEFERIGGQQTTKIDVRIISATNKNLLAEIKKGNFREDLYYRLNVFPIEIPALRDRTEDIELLVKHFIKKFSTEHTKNIENISKADMIRLIEYSWPGNIRELINVIERSIISSQNHTLKLDWTSPNQPENIVLSFSIEEVERAHILKVLKDCNWKINGNDGAALKLGLNPNTLRSRLKKMNISRAESS